MIITEIVTENLGEYRQLIPPDVADNIGRIHHKGIALHEHEGEPPVAVLVYTITGAGWDGVTKDVVIEWGFMKDDEGSDEILAFLKEECIRKKVSSLRMMIPADDEVNYRILKRCGYECVEAESPFIDLTVQEVLDLNLGKVDTGAVVPISEITIRQFRRGLTNMIFHGARGLLEDAEYLPKEWFEQELSCFVPNGNGSNAALLVRKSSSGVLVPVVLYATGHDAAENMIRLMNFFAKRAGELYDHSARVRIVRFNANTRALAKKLCPEKKGEKVYIFTHHSI